jgi:cytochrome c oxidase assembly protein subunit 15
MVKSGLVDDPHVSQYRLSAHLIAAFLIYGYMLWVALSLRFRHRDGPRHAWYSRAFALAALVTVTIISGGFVAGLKAGYAYNTFPLMGGEWIPPGLFAFEPQWRNVFDNVVTVQFNHRVLAVTTFLAVAVFWVSARRAALPRRVRTAMHAMFLLACTQVVLGISTLVLHVPIALAAAHQATALLVFTSLLVVCHGLRGRAELTI